MADGSSALGPDDMRFLLEFRDYLNSAAYPASGSTIAFSTFVSDGAAGHRLADARRAYPGFEALARRLRLSVFLLRGAALMVTIMVALMGAYVFWGNAIVASTNSAITARDNLAKDIAREEATGLTKLYANDYEAPPAGSLFPKQIAHISGVAVSTAGTPPSEFGGFLSLCDAIAQSAYAGKPVQVYLSSAQDDLPPEKWTPVRPTRPRRAFLCRSVSSSRSRNEGGSDCRIPR